MKKQIIEIIKLFKNPGAALLSLDCTAFEKNIVSWNNLEMYCSVPFETGVTVGINNGLLLKAFAAFDKPSYSVDKNSVLKLREGNKSLSIGGDSLSNFPVPIKEAHTHIGRFDAADLLKLKESILFQSKDDLRPAMTYTHVDSHIAATDAHRLYYPRLSHPLTQNIFLHERTIKIMLIFGGDWNISYRKQENDKSFQPAAFTLVNEQGVKITQRDCDAPFPDWRRVIPEIDKDTPIAHFDKKEMLRVIKDGAPFANKSTGQMILEIDAKPMVTFADLDFNLNYSSEINVEFDPKKPIRIAFDLKLMSGIFALCPDKVKVAYFSPTKCIILEDRFLLMPLALNN